MNRDGPLIGLSPDGAVKHRLIVAAHLLLALCYNDKEEMAEYVGVTKRTIDHLFEGKNIGIKLPTLQRAARQFVEDGRKGDDKYEWAAHQRLLSIIDPNATILMTRTGGNFPQLVKDHLELEWQNHLSHTVWHFHKLGVQKLHTRKTIRRLIVRYPYLAIRVTDDHKSAHPDVIDSRGKVGTEQEMIMLRDGKLPQVEAVRPARPVPTALGPEERRAIKALREVNEAKAAAEARATRKDPAPLPDKNAAYKKSRTSPVGPGGDKGHGKVVTVEPVRNIIEEIAERGVSQSVKDRVARLLGSGE